MFLPSLTMNSQIWLHIYKSVVSSISSQSRQISLVSASSVEASEALLMSCVQGRKFLSLPWWLKIFSLIGKKGSGSRGVYVPMRGPSPNLSCKHLVIALRKQLMRDCGLLLGLGI